MPWFWSKTCPTIPTKKRAGAVQGLVNVVRFSPNLEAELSVWAGEQPVRGGCAATVQRLSEMLRN
jgi:hypothetical protein